MDNAHGLHRAPEYDHRRVYGRRKVVPYQYRGPAELLEDFCGEVDRARPVVSGLTRERRRPPRRKNRQ